MSVEEGSTRDATEATSGEELLQGREADTVPVLSIVMPTLNEEEGVVECIEAIKRAIEELQVPAEIIVSDSSTDRTPDLAREHGAIVVSPDQGGYGYAYRYAFEHSRGDYLVMGDADTTYDFEELPKLFRLVADGGADIAMGSRLDGEIKDGAMPALHRYVGNPLLTRFLNTFYDAGVSDAHSGFRVIDRKVLAALELESDGMEFASEMVMKAAAMDLDIEEVPITYRERTGEATLESFRDGWRHVKFMLLNAPTYLFTLPAIGFIGLGLSVMLISLFGVSIGGVTFGANSVIAGSLMAIVGYQVGSLSLFSGVAGDPIKTPSDPLVTWMTDQFRLEHGVFAGLLLAGLGGGYVALMVSRWITSGFTALPFVEWNMVAFTAIVLGVQTTFQSFFLSLVASD